MTMSRSVASTNAIQKCLPTNKHVIISTILRHISCAPKQESLPGCKRLRRPLLLPGTRERPDELPTCCPPLIALVCLCLCGHINLASGLVPASIGPCADLAQTFPNRHCNTCNKLDQNLEARFSVQRWRVVIPNSVGTCHSKRRMSSIRDIATAHFYCPFGLSRYALSLHNELRGVSDS